MVSQESELEVYFKENGRQFKTGIDHHSTSGGGYSTAVLKPRNEIPSRNGDSQLSSSLSNGVESVNLKKKVAIESEGASHRHTRFAVNVEDEKKAAKLRKMAGAVETLIECIEEDPCRDGLAKTPLRVAKSLLFLTHGYSQTLEQVVDDAIFDENHHEMVVVKDIEFYSLCEHHMIPFLGKVHIGYIPNGKVLGLSKLARLAEMYSRRLQVQERLNVQIANALVEILKPEGVGVVIEASHMCMCMRGVQKHGAKTTTSAMRGCFSDRSVRQEFLSHVYHRS